MLLVEGADGLLEGLLRHLQLGGDEFGRGMISERQETVAAMQCLEDGSLGRVDHLAIADGLEAEVDLVVLAHAFDPGTQPFADVQLLEDLVMI